MGTPRTQIFHNPMDRTQPEPAPDPLLIHMGLSIRINTADRTRIDMPHHTWVLTRAGHEDGH